jgi:hypothetical protein
MEKENRIISSPVDTSAISKDNNFKKEKIIISSVTPQSPSEKKCDKDLPHSIELNILFFTSFFFITNSITAFYKGYYFYSFLFFLLTITSVIFHTNYNIYTNILDKFSILFIVLYGGYLLYNKISIDKYILVLISILSFLLTIFLYSYGYISKQYCFDQEKCIGDRYHGLLHLISCIGHHCVIFL